MRKFGIFCGNSTFLTVHYTIKGISFLTRYTSLGGMNDTIPNPALKTSTGYDPAYALKDGSLERNGRNHLIDKST